MAQTPPSFRFPFANLGKLPPEAQAAHLATFNALTDIYQAIAQQKENSSTSTTTINETIQGTSGTSGGGSSAGVTSFNAETGNVFFFPELGIVNNQTGNTSYITQNSDNGAVVILNDSSAIAVGLLWTVTSPWYCWIANYGSGLATLTPSPSGGISTITYPGNIAASSMPLPSNFAALINFDGTNFWAIQTSISGSAGVTQIIAGTNITISPVGGTGVVTVNASSTNGLSGMTAGQVPIAATATTVTSSKALAGSGAGITTGPASGVTTGDLASFTGTGGQIADSGILASSVVTNSGNVSWTPTDQSGAGLTFSSVSVGSCRVGNMVFVYGTLAYPTTADTSIASIGGLPVAVASSSYASITTGSVIPQNSSSTTATMGVILTAGSTKFGLAYPSGGASTSLRNNVLSNNLYWFNFSYPVV